MTLQILIQVRDLLGRVCQITDAHRMAKKLYNHRFAPDYNVFDFIEPDEMRLSKILAWFLNPHQTHGQGSRFLLLFLDALRVDARAEEWDHAEVRTEFSIEGGRLDILLRTASLWLAIENKPWAGDQDSQLKRYFAQLDTSAGPNYRVVYLTSKGRAPPEHCICKHERDRRIEAGQLHLWGYEREVLAWLTKCRAECRADRVSKFIDEFSRYIRAVFGGVRDGTMSDHLLDEITRSPDKVSGAMQVIFMADAIRRRLLSDLRQQLLGRLPNHNVDIVDDPGTKYSGYKIDFSEQSPYRFGLEFQNTQFTCLIVGISRKKQSPTLGNEHESLVSSFGKACHNDEWLWYRRASPADSLLPVPENWRVSTEPWIEIANGTLASRIVEAFTRTHDVLKKASVMTHSLDSR